MTIQRACSACGCAFVPRDRRQTRCPEHELRGREHRSPTTRAQNAMYQRNRRILLQSRPPCALRIVCDGAPADTADHRVAVANGGSNALDNLQPACRACNLAKGTRTAPEGGRVTTSDGDKRGVRRAPGREKNRQLKRSVPTASAEPDRSSPALGRARP